MFAHWTWGHPLCLWGQGNAGDHNRNRSPAQQAPLFSLFPSPTGAALRTHQHPRYFPVLATSCGTFAPFGRPDMGQSIGTSHLTPVGSGSLLLQGNVASNVASTVVVLKQSKWFLWTLKEVWVTDQLSDLY